MGNLDVFDLGKTDICAGTKKNKKTATSEYSRRWTGVHTIHKTMKQQNYPAKYGFFPTWQDSDVRRVST
jgi:hypothetical protein